MWCIDRLSRQMKTSLCPQRNLLWKGNNLAGGLQPSISKLVVIWRSVKRSISFRICSLLISFPFAWPVSVDHRTNIPSLREHTRPHFHKEVSDPIAVNRVGTNSMISGAIVWLVLQTFDVADPGFCTDSSWLTPSI